MTTEDPERSARETADAMERDAEQMKQRIDDLGESIDEAEKTKERRQEAGSDAIGDVAGDWEGEAAGADHGDDAVDAPHDDADKRDADG